MSDSAKKGMSITRMIISLGIICIVASVILAITYEVTQEPISEATKTEQVNAIKAVAPEFDNDPVADSISITLNGDQTPVKLFPALKDGTLKGAAVESYTTKGFSGQIKVMVGFDLDGNIIDYRVLNHSETPGLGAKMEEWFRDSVGHRSVVGLNPSTTPLKVSKDAGGQVDGITAATISSRAFLDAVMRASEAFNQYKTANK